LSNQNEGPPAGQFPDDVPANADRGDSAPARGNRREEPKFDVGTEIKVFYKMIDDPVFLGQLKGMLPDNIPIETFVRTAKTAVQGDPNLLNPEWRASLMQGVSKAAAQGLLPDGKHGALVPRYDDKARRVQVCWQPMVWGITQLGRRAGALKKITAHIVFDGEEFEILGGAEDRIHHKINPVIVEKAYEDGKTPDKFMQHVAFAYCIITAPDGTPTWRYMTRSRIARVRASSKAAKGPWNGPFMDEMILKTVILFTSKHIDTDGDTPELRRFRDALETDMEADFDETGEPKTIEHEQQQSANDTKRLPAPSALDKLSEQLNARTTEQVTGGGAEKVTVGGGEESQQQQETKRQETKQPQDDPQPKTEASSEQRKQEPKPQQKPQGQMQDDAAKKKADSWADKFKAGAIGTISNAVGANDAQRELEGMFSNDAVLRGLMRLREGWRRTHYADVVSALAAPDVVNLIGFLQGKVEAIYQDVIDFIASRDQDEAA
jgi:recombination protein RecT